MTVTVGKRWPLFLCYRKCENMSVGSWPLFEGGSSQRLKCTVY